MADNLELTNGNQGIIDYKWRLMQKNLNKQSYWKPNGTVPVGDDQKIRWFLSDAWNLQLIMFWVLRCRITCWWVLLANGIVTYIIHLCIVKTKLVTGWSGLCFTLKRCHGLRFSSSHLVTCVMTDRSIQRIGGQALKAHT